MSNALPIRTIADLIRDLGVSSDRILFNPPPGTATEQDLLDLERHENRLAELVDGVLVEKAMGFEESLIAMALASALREFVVPRNLGVVSGPDGMMRILSGTIRIPDVAFIAWSRFPDGKLTGDPIPEIAPDLAIEVLSSSNTASEMQRKCREYFDSGTQLVWLIDPASRTVAVYSTPSESIQLPETATLDGGDVLTGFSLSLRELFGELDRTGPS